MSLAVCVDLDKTEQVMTFMKEMDSRIERMSSFPLMSDLKIRLLRSPDYYRLLFTCDEFYFFPLWYVALPCAVTMMIFSGITWWLLLPIGLSAIDYFRSNLFVYHILRLSLRKSGYKGKIRRVSLAELVKRL